MSTKLLMALLPFLILSCSKDSQNNSAETEHFIFKWEAGQVTSNEIEEAKVFAERIHAEYEVYFGVDKLPEGKTIVNMGGDGFTNNDSQPTVPYVGENSEIFLFRFATGYLGELPHEYVHVLRLYQGWSSDGFLEEGIAEAISARLFPENVGFSLYGFSTTIAAGMWLSEDGLIPLRDLKDRHGSISFRCLAQSYPLRADFFSFLIEEYGKQNFMDFVYSSGAGTYENYQNYFEKNFDELEQEWLQNLQLRLDEVSDNESKILGYKQKLEELRFYVCQDGIDF